MWVEVLLPLLALLVILLFAVLAVYFRYSTDRRLKFKCPVCEEAHKAEEFRWSEKEKVKICAKCKARELNQREIGE